MSTPTTVAVEPAAPWRTRPGWGISVDLTPPEVLEERAVARLRRLLGSGLLAVLVVVGLVFLLAARHHGKAEDALEQQETIQTQLRSEARSYSAVSQMQASLQRLNSQIATLMAGDVRFDTLAAALVEPLPAGMRLDSQNISVNQGGAAAAGATGATTPTASGALGTVTMSGTGRSLDDVASYVERLQAIEGVADVVPTSNTRDQSGVSFTITLNLTDALLSHRFDADSAGDTTAGDTAGSAQ